MRRRRGGFWRWLRSVTAARALTRRGSGMSVCRASATGCCCFNARGPAGLIDGKAPGDACKLDDAQRQALAAIVERGPIPAIREAVRWRLADLAHWIWEEFGISLSDRLDGGGGQDHLEGAD